MKERTTQIRANVVIDIATIIDIETEKQKKPSGKVLEYFLNDSPKFKEAKQKLKNFKETY